MFRKRRFETAAAARPVGRLQEAETARPLASLVFLSPFLVFYAAGLIWVRPDLAARADILLRDVLRLLGLTGILAPTWLAVVVLLVWHLVRRDPWRVPAGLLGRMAAETVILTVPLFVILALFHSWQHAGLDVGAAAGRPPFWLAVAMTSIGAGIYEELLFRLLMVGGMIFLVRHVLRNESYGVVVAVVLMTAALFAGAHTLDDPSRFSWLSFLYRTAAGAYLGFVFAYRGFGIVAGVHMVFDLVIKLAAILGGGF